MKFKTSTILKFVLMCLVIVFESCKTSPPAPDEVFQKYRDAVVLIYTEYYFKINIDNSFIVYYSPSTNQVYNSETDVQSNCSAASGTGFIISKNGEIITNSHVVTPKFEGKEYIQSLIRDYIVLQSNKLTVINYKLDSIKNLYTQNQYTLTDYEKEQLDNEYRELNLEKIPISGDFHQYLNIDLGNIKATLVNKRIGIAYNDTYVTTLADLQDCVVIKNSENEAIDLALIQTKTKLFNHEVANIFDFSEHRPKDIIPVKDESSNEKLKINSPVYMIGFNKGFSLGITKDGIKPQFTSGVISQETNSERILYTIPTLHGSSGSPIVDEWGNLVAVNFAKVDESQGFSFGIPVNLVETFYSK